MNRESSTIIIVNLLYLTILIVFEDSIHLNVNVYLNV